MWDTTRIATITFIMGFGLAYGFIGCDNIKAQMQYNKKKAELADSIQNLHFTYGKMLSEQNVIALEILRNHSRNCD